MNAAKHNALMIQLAAEKLARAVARSGQNGQPCPVAARALNRLFSTKA